jgi:hypothetical protein
VKSVVTYQCVVNGCGLRLVGIVPDDGRPRIGFWLGNTSIEMARPGGGTSWRIGNFLDAPTKPRTHEARIADLEVPDDVKSQMLKRLQQKEAELEVWLVSCRRRNHGPWEIPPTVMLEHWNQARMSGHLSVKLDDASPWKYTASS